MNKKRFLNLVIATTFAINTFNFSIFKSVSPKVNADAASLPSNKTVTQYSDWSSFKPSNTSISYNDGTYKGTLYLKSVEEKVVSETPGKVTELTHDFFYNHHQDLYIWEGNGFRPNSFVRTPGNRPSIGEVRYYNGNPYVYKGKGATRSGINQIYWNSPNYPTGPEILKKPTASSPKGSEQPYNHYGAEYTFSYEKQETGTKSYNYRGQYEGTVSLIDTGGEEDNPPPSYSLYLSGSVSPNPSYIRLSSDSDKRNTPIRLDINASLNGYSDASNVSGWEIVVEKYGNMVAQKQVNISSLNLSQSIDVIATYNDLNRSSIDYEVTICAILDNPVTSGNSQIYSVCTTKEADIPVSTNIVIEPPVPPEPPTPPNGPPVARFTLPTSAGINANVPIYEYSQDSDGVIINKTWEVNPSGYMVGDPKSGSVKFTKPGTYTLSLTVVDDGGLMDSESKTIEIINQEPIAEFSLPSTVFQGEKFSVTNSSVDPDGSIAQIKWEIGTANADKSKLIGTLNDKGATDVYFDVEGTYTITITVIDDNGKSATKKKQITVKSAIPTAIINVSGDLKQNRAVKIDGKNSCSPTSTYPITDYVWEVLPITQGVTKNDVKIRTTTTKELKDILFKKPGRYNVRLQVKNAKHSSEWIEKIINITEDKAPKANFFVPSALLRDPNNNNKVIINPTDYSYSMDGDTIAQRIWKYKFDSNNDGSFADENWVVVSNANEVSPTITLTNVGKYLLELEVKEKFGEPTLEEFVISTDRLTDNTLDKESKEKTFEVDNINPYVSFLLGEKKKVDVVFTIGKTDSSKTSDLNSKINTYVKSQLNAKNIDAKITSIETVNKVVTRGKFSVNIYWEANGSDMDASMNFYSNGAEQGKVYFGNKSLYGCSLDKDDTTGGSGEWLTLNFDTIPASIDKIKFNASSFRGSATTDLKLYKENEDNDKQLHISKTNYISNKENVYFGELVRNGTGWDFVGSNGEFVSGNVVTENIKSFDEVLKQPEWRSEAEHFLINISDIPLSELNIANPNPNLLTPANSIFNGTHNWEALMNEGSSAQSYTKVSSGGHDGNNYLSVYGRGIYGDLGIGTNVDVKPNTEYDISTYVKIPSSGVSTGVGLLNVVSNKTVNLVKLNPSSGPRHTDWVQLKGRFNSGDNSSLLIALSRGNISEVQFTEIELKESYSNNAYPLILSRLLSNEISFVGMGNDTNKDQYSDIVASNSSNGTFIDNANIDIALDELSKYILGKMLVDEQPIKYILVGQEINYLTYYSDIENDPEYERKWKFSHNQYYYNNSQGLASFNNQWIKNPITSFDKVGEYTIALQVRDNPVGPDNRFDNYRKWSNPENATMKVYVHRKPIAQFSASAIPQGPMYVTNVNENSYDLDHQSESDKGIVERVWKWKIAENDVWNEGFLPSKLRVGQNYIVQLQVKDKEGAWSDPAVQFVTTKNVNIEPVAQFTLSPNPLPISKPLVVHDTSYDPNGDPIAERQWTIEKNGSKIYTGENLPTNFGAYGIGDYNISLKVKDSPKTGLPLWSEVYIQTLKVVADNTKPIANFTVSPNPVPLDVGASFTESSTDPDGDILVAKEWQIMKSGTSTWVPISQPPTDFTAYGLGTHSVRLRVKDQPSLPQLDSLWSEWCTKTITVIAGNKKPVAIFTVSPNPVPADEPVNYNDTSYDPEGKIISQRVWTVKNLETGAIYQYDNQQPPTVFEGTGWGANGDGVGTYEITLKVKDTSPNGLSPAQWSDEAKQILVVEDPLRIINLQMVGIINPPFGTTAPINYPVGTPTKIKAGYRMAFKVATNGGDKVDIKLYANGMPLTVHTDDGDNNTIMKATTRKNSTTIFSFWTDKDLPKGTVIDMKIILTKTKANGTIKSLVNNELGNHFGVIVGSAKEDSSINLTK